MVSKNTICLWFDGTAEDAAKFYAATFPDSAVSAVRRAPADYPSGKKGDVGLGCDELRAAADRGDLAPDVPVAAYTGELAVRLGRPDHAVLGRHDGRIVELAGLAHVDEQVVAADVQHVDTVDRRDRLHVVQAFHRLDHAHEQAGVVELRHALGERHGAVVEMRIPAHHRALADRRELAGLDRALRIGRSADIGKDDAGRAIVENERGVEVMAAPHPHQRRHSAAERCLRDVPDRLEREQRMLPVDEDEVVPGGLGDAGDIARARQPHDHAERHITRAHAFDDRVFQFCCSGHCQSSSVPSGRHPLVAVPNEPRSDLILRSPSEARASRRMGGLVLRDVHLALRARWALSMRPIESIDRLQLLSGERRR